MLGNVPLDVGGTHNASGPGLLDQAGGVVGDVAGDVVGDQVVNQGISYGQGIKERSQDHYRRSSGDGWRTGCCSKQSGGR